MVNSLANHGFLPRDGANVSMDDLISALNSSVNLAEDATRLVGAKALTLSTTGNNTTFNLDDLNKHGGIEHDGSLSRADAALGDNHSFNATIFAGVTAHFVDETISIATAAAARAARLAAARAENPAFNMTASDLQFSFIETALYLSVFKSGNGTSNSSVVARRDWVKTLFGKAPYFVNAPQHLA